MKKRDIVKNIKKETSIDLSWLKAGRNSLKNFMAMHPVKREERVYQLKPALNFWKFKFTPTLIIILILAMTLGGTTYAAQDSLPTDVLYPIKLATEELELALNFDEEREIALKTGFASERIREVEELAKKRDVNPEVIEKTLFRFEKRVDAVQRNLEKLAKTTNKPAIARAAINLESALTTHQEVLERVAVKAPVAAQAGILKAQEASIKGSDTAINVVAGVAVPETEPVKGVGTEVKVTEFAEEVSPAEPLQIKTPAVTAETGKIEIKIDEKKVIIIDGGLKYKVLNRIERLKNKIEIVEKRLNSGEYDAEIIEKVKNLLEEARENLTEAEKLLGENKPLQAYKKANAGLQLVIKALRLLFDTTRVCPAVICDINRCPKGCEIDENGCYTGRCKKLIPIDPGGPILIEIDSDTIPLPGEAVPSENIKSEEPVSDHEYEEGQSSAEIPEVEAEVSR